MNTKVFLTLIALTLLTFLVGYFNFVGTFIIGALLLSVFIKGHLILEYFMGLKDVQLKYRILPTIWLIGVIILIFIAYYLPINA